MKLYYIKTILSLLLVLTMLVSCTATNFEISDTPFFLEEAQICSTDKQGIRFVAYLEKGLYDLTYGEEANFGILIARKDQLSKDVEVTIENATAVPAKKLLEDTDSYCRFSAVVTDQPAESYGVELIARAYVEVDGTVYYSDPITRTLIKVAERIVEQNENADNVAVAQEMLVKYREAGAGNAASNNRLIVYPEYPDQIARDYMYNVSVTQGSETQELVVYNQTEAFFYQTRFNGDVNRRFCEFAFSGAPITVHVKVNCDFDTYAVVPTSKGFASTYADGVISVTLKKPEQFLIILDDDVDTALAVFADERETDAPRKDSPNTIYVEGWNQITFNESGATLENGILTISKENTRLYIAPGAVLTARVVTTGSAAGVKIFGRGALLDPASMIYHESEHGFDNATSDSIFFVRIKGYNSEIKDIKLLDSRGYNLNVERGNCTVQNIKILSTMMTSDGISTTAENGTVKDCFVYCGDNALLPQVGGSNRGYTFNNITVGTTCSAIYPQYGVNSTLSNIYVFRADEGLISMKEESNGAKYLTINNLDALDCASTLRLFYAAKQGSAEKVITINKLLMRSTGTLANAKTSIDFASDAGSNFTINFTDLYVGGTLIKNKSQISIDGSSSLKQLKFTSTTSTPSVLKGSQLSANYSYTSKVMLGYRELFLDVKPVKQGDAWYLPYGEIASYLAITPQNPITTQIDGVEMISLADLVASRAVTAASYKNGAIRLTPAINSGINLFKENYLHSSNYDLYLHRSHTAYLVADCKNGEWIYTAKAESDQGGIVRMILDVYQTYGKGSYTLKFDYQSSTLPILVGIGVDFNQTKYTKRITGNSSTGWETATITFNLTDDPASVEQMALWFRVSSETTISLKNISLTKTS